MRILVVGGAGFIGTNYIQCLVNGELKGISELMVLDSFTYASNKEECLKLSKNHDFEVINLDIRNRDKVLQLPNNFDLLINFAAESHVDRSIANPTDFLTTNILGVQNLLDLAMKKDCKYLQVSTDEVYGTIESGSWDEHFPLSPNSPYAASKASADLLVRSYINTFGLNGVITRSCNNFGNYQHSEKFIPKVITSLISGTTVPIYGSGKNIREWIYVMDNLSAIHEVLLLAESGNVFNIGSGIELSNIDLFNKICELGDFDNSNFIFISDRLGHDFRYSLNSNLLMEQFLWKPKFDFDKNLLDTINWYKSSLGLAS
jgi:dTDP-glucose 4,6-dehydratase